MEKYLKEILFDEKQIEAKVKELGEQITNDYKGEEVVVVCILKGAMLFTADLIRHIKTDVILDGMVASSYGAGTETSGIVRIIKDMDTNIEGRHVLIVDDIIDTGTTLKNLMDVLKQRNPKSIKSCTFLDKPARRKVDYNPEYVGYDIPDEFVIGYGLDFDGKYRHLPFVGVLHPDEYQN